MEGECKAEHAKCGDGASLEWELASKPAEESALKN